MSTPHLRFPASHLRGAALAILVAVALGVAQPPAVAHAQPSPSAASDEDRERARALFVEGKRLFDLRRFAEALARYEAAYDLTPLPALLINIAQCHRNLENYREAVFSYRRYLELVPDAPRAGEIRELIDELEELEARRANSQRPLPLVATDAAPPPRATPLYRRWWVWAGVAAVAAGTVTAALVLGSGDDVPDTDLGNVDFPR